MTDRARILVTRKLPQTVEDRLQKQFRPEFNRSDEIYPISRIIKAAAGFDALLVTATEKCDAQMISALPDSIKIIATYSVGYDHIDIEAARKAGIAVTNTPDVLTDATADLAILLMLGAARGAYWGERMVREKTWAAWSPTNPLGLDVTGKRLGILGMGRIGQAVAHRARAFNMQIHYHNRSRLDAEKQQQAVFHSQLEQMLPLCDFLSINCASTAQTRNIINAETLAMLPKNAVIINTARGDIIDDEALISALSSHQIAAAGLDVFNNEPDIDPRYRELENVFLLPHLGSATPDTRNAMGMRAIDNLESFFNATTPGDLVT